MITSNKIKNITDVRVATVCTTQVHSPGHAEAFSVVPFLPNRGLWDLKQDNCLSVTDGRWDSWRSLQDGFGIPEVIFGINFEQRSRRLIITVAHCIVDRLATMLLILMLIKGPTAPFLLFPGTTGGGWACGGRGGPRWRRPCWCLAAVQPTTHYRRPRLD